MKTAALLVALVAPAIAATSGRGQMSWSTLAPAGEGFSVEVPGSSQPTKEPGHYVYGNDDQAFIIKVDPVSPAIREFVEERAREPIEWFLQRIARGLTNNGQATVLFSSSEDFEGYPSLLISHEQQAENLAVEGTDRLVLTEEHLYMLITVSRKGVPKADVDRFFASFHLRNPRPASTTTRPAPAASSNPLVAKLAGPMLIVARLITEEQLNPRIDQIVQNAPPAERLGARWGPANASWPPARVAITDRIARLFAMYETSGELNRFLESEVTRLASGPDGAALTAALNGPAGDAILRNSAMMQFVSTVMAGDPNGPKAGERTWGEKMRALRQAFDEHAGPAMPLDDGTHGADLADYMAGPAHQLSMNLWQSVVGKATNQLDGAINLMMFDDRENIFREMEAAIAPER